jgi:hypothetical protein
MPGAHCLAGDAELAGDHGLEDASGKQLGRAEPAPLELVAVALGLGAAGCGGQQAPPARSGVAVGAFCVIGPAGQLDPHTLSTQSPRPVKFRLSRARVSGWPKRPDLSCEVEVACLSEALQEAIGSRGQLLVTRIQGGGDDLWGVAHEFVADHAVELIAGGKERLEDAEHLCGMNSRLRCECFSNVGACVENSGKGRLLESRQPPYWVEPSAPDPPPKASEFLRGDCACSHCFGARVPEPFEAVDHAIGDRSFRLEQVPA